MQVGSSVSTADVSFVCHRKFDRGLLLRVGCSRSFSYEALNPLPHKSCRLPVARPFYRVDGAYLWPIGLSHTHTHTLFFPIFLNIFVSHLSIASLCFQLTSLRLFSSLFPMRYSDCSIRSLVDDALLYSIHVQYEIIMTSSGDNPPPPYPLHGQPADSSIANPVHTPRMSAIYRRDESLIKRHLKVSVVS